MIRLLFPEFCSIKEDHGVVSVLFKLGLVRKPEWMVGCSWESDSRLQS